jgi:NhaA family Na+:H+ antiporter
LEPAAKSSLLRRIVYPFQEFEQTQARSGLLVLFTALVALAWFNSPWGASYTQTWNTPLTIAFGKLSLSKPLTYWINNALMAAFFLVITLELKRMFRAGELYRFRDAAFAVAAALGGLAFPAGLYLYLNDGLAGQSGWTIPLATDVTAALALLGLAGRNVPLALRAFLAASAILQTLGAVLLSLALYTSVTNLLSLSVGTGIFGLLVVLRALRNRSMWLYLLLGLIMWGAFLLAGVNGAVAGVLLALVIPVHSRVSEEEFIATADTVMGQLHALHMVKRPEREKDIEEDYQATAHTLKANCREALSPLRRLLHQLLPWAAYAVLPLFVLSNAAFAYNSFEVRELLGSVSMGIVLALVVGKPIGMLLLAWLATASRIASKPRGTTWGQLAGAALLAGTGFTMSLFVAGEALTDTALVVPMKISIFLSSVIAAIAGLLLLLATVKE